MLISEIKFFTYKHDKIPFILEKLGCTQIKYHEYKGYYSCCNADNGDNPNAVTIYNNENLNVRDYTRDLSKISNYPDIFTLIQYYKKCDFKSALKWLHESLDLKMEYSPRQKENFESPENCFVSLCRYKKNTVEYQYEYLDEDILLDYYPYIHKDFAKVGIFQSTVDKFRLSYSYNFRRTIIPVRYWYDGKLIGIRGRTSVPNYELLGIPKYFPLKPYSIGNNLYGLWENYTEIADKTKKVIIFEAEKSVLKLDSMQPIVKTILNENIYGVALCSHNISEEQVRILSSLNLKEIIIALDNDMDINITRGICEKFREIGRNNVTYMFDKDHILPDQSSPIDETIESFADLYLQRKIYDDEEHDNYMKYIQK